MDVIMWGWLLFGIGFISFLHYEEIVLLLLFDWFLWLLFLQ